jgi:hypothetical protein
MDTLTALQFAVLDFHQLADLYDDLTERLADARENREDAWRIANNSTVEEGFSMAEWAAKKDAALALDQVCDELYARREAISAAMDDAACECEVDCTPLGGW